ncbi:hypothetical protein Pmar_PMAR003627 [Perkinsus marinus ATCC 50983]|uniref:NADP-dependent oxidoreductase domain-containing protein n=1 Tax=Perkinsus marinus (strain ATCC 50983 / TXsc) TaxID=423536 RepID=C5KHV2_PERM5|nr:hypothetical protein Pmar_PMAR003627 [Perkinsus marinus ATCC 50983]EER16164.1 hypothetical protein Pmar_PMAR003627 [Perkinsus marinus ATCC 50983]|eukprot:XP_002784368.1 hypothetical protein Pmar_PMAR003627 [Perkinsus marinus ATCC 50983]
MNLVADIKTGNLSIDNAFMYGNHHGVGQESTQTKEAGIVTREKFFVSRKL